MTPEAQRIAIAEACGWTMIKARNNYPPAWWKDDLGAHEFPPDYLNDLNAMHEAEKVLKFGEWGTYTEHLIDDSYTPLGSPHLGYETCHATAAQRAEAFLKTLGLWKD
jgi:hypothetical protein